MMHDEHKDTQAAKLEQLFLEVTNQESQLKEQEEPSEDYIEIDVLQLPPRSEVHKGKKSGLHLSFRSPVVRLMAVIIILLGLMVVIKFLWGRNYRVFA